MKIAPFMNRKTSHFLGLYEQGGIHRAAEHLGLTQPALTMSLKQLEGELGTALFTRSARGLTPTPAGETYYRYASTLRQSAEYAAAEIAEQVSGASGSLRIGAGVAWSTTIIPATLVEINRRYPKLSIELVTGVADQLGALFESGQIDVLMSADPFQPLSSPDYQQAFLLNVPMVAIAGQASALSGRKSVSVEELGAVDWAGFHGDDSLFHNANNLMARHGLPAPNIVMRTNSIVALTEFVAGTSAVTVVTKHLAEKMKPAGLSSLNVEKPLWDIPVSLISRQIAWDIDPMRCFRQLVNDGLREIL